MGNNNIGLTKTEKIKFAYRLFMENSNYDEELMQDGLNLLEW